MIKPISYVSPKAGLNAGGQMGIDLHEYLAGKFKIPDPELTNSTVVDPVRKSRARAGGRACGRVPKRSQRAGVEAESGVGGGGGARAGGRNKNGKKARKGLRRSEVGCGRTGRPRSARCTESGAHGKGSTANRSGTACTILKVKMISRDGYGMEDKCETQRPRPNGDIMMMLFQNSDSYPAGGLGNMRSNAVKFTYPTEFNIYLAMGENIFITFNEWRSKDQKKGWQILNFLATAEHEIMDSGARASSVSARRVS
ncbi:hypothetical protein C8R45DRAFT_1073066 [Mycena sanguinolenta]|nr:hypothetical protein C8R45DRAFT_1073066 [Mycena sanguinolenta]